MPDSLPAPSHLYWAPLTSLSAGAAMWILDAPDSYAAAQAPFTLMFFGAALLAYWLAGYLGGGARHRWTAGTLTLFSGFFSRFWGATDTFAPYALIGASALVLLGFANVALQEAHGDRRRLVTLSTAAGALSGLGHLTRPDGALLALIGLLIVIWRMYRGPVETRSLLYLRWPLATGWS